MKKIISRLSKYISDYCKPYIIRERINAKSMPPNIVNYNVDFLMENSGCKHVIYLEIMNFHWLILRSQRANGFMSR